MSKSNKTDNEEANWDDLYDENGEAVSDDIITDFNNKLRLNTNSNCRDAGQEEDHPEDFNDTKCSNILEIYDFSTDLKTRDLVGCLASNNIKNFDIEWVDDSHALAIFATTQQASLALKQTFGILKLRSLKHAARESKLKAKKKLVSIPARPETSCVLARRLVTGALGIKLDSNTEQMKMEREKLRLAKEKKAQSRKLKKDAWDGNVS